MLYLEDFLEVIELIPQEIRDRTTDLRELDLGIQNTSDQLEEQIKTFFGNAKKMKQQERDAEYEKIRKEYYKLLVDADEKVNIATNMHDLLERYCRKLDQELEKFKLELEADSPGITEMLEKRSLELDEPTRDNQKENRCVSMGVRSSSGERRQTSAATNNVKKEERVEPHPTSSLSLSPPSSTISYTLGHMGAGSNAIAAAASQAIAATQQMQQGRRTASLKASYDAVTLGVHPTEFSIGSELANAAQTALAASALPQEPVTTSTSTSSNKRQKKKHPASTSSSGGGGGGGGGGGSGGSAAGGSSSSTAIPIPAGIENSPVPSEDFIADSFMDANSENPDWTYDPNEPRYCVCNQVSYGDMVACDNPKCPLEWFHYPCVGITAPPKGKWYCPQCASSMNRRSRK